MAPPPSDSEELVAAIDLGSNSFHMIVGRLSQGQLHIVDKVRERVRLGAGLDERRRLTPASQTRALDCLARFEERLRGMSPGRVRAVGTNTLRKAKNGPEFLEQAHEVLGHRIEVISGHEEARLIYLGAQQSLPAEAQHRLVIDIGGGSTECVLGKRAEILQVDSLFMGCVSHSQRFFGGGRFDTERFDEARRAAELEVQTIVRRYRALGWSEAVGCSGTIHAVKKIARANDWSTGDITPDVLEHIERALVDAGRLSDLDLPGLAEDRRPVIAGGVAILRALFDLLGIERMIPSPGALREGALYDLVGRIQHEDVRDRTIRWFCQQHRVDLEQAARVERTSHALLERVAGPWKLDVDDARQLLSWAAHLHELGLSLSHTGYHKHGAYIVQNADMAGFSKDDQHRLSALIRGHRRKLKKSYFSNVPKALRKATRRLAVLFRVAVAFNRGRAEEPLPDLDVKAKKKKLVLYMPKAWLEAHPLTVADLEDHARYVKKVGFALRVKKRKK